MLKISLRVHFRATVQPRHWRFALVPPATSVHKWLFGQTLPSKVNSEHSEHCRINPEEQKSVRKGHVTGGQPTQQQEESEVWLPVARLNSCLICVLIKVCAHTHYKKKEDVSANVNTVFWWKCWLETKKMPLPVYPLDLFRAVVSLCREANQERPAALWSGANRQIWRWRWKVGVKTKLRYHKAEIRAQASSFFKETQQTTKG